MSDDDAFAVFGGLFGLLFVIAIAISLRIWKRCCKDHTRVVNDDNDVFVAVEEPSSGGDACAICLDDQPDSFVYLPCCHRFHSECVIPWLRVARICPICRFSVD